MNNKYVFLTALLIWNSLCYAQTTIKDRYFDGEKLFSTVKKYVELGEHRTGTSTDLGTSEWIGEELKSAGYTVNYLEFSIRQFFPENVFLTNGKDSINAFPLWWVNEKINRSVSGKLVDVNKGGILQKGDIALIHLPLKNVRGGTKTKIYVDSIVSIGIVGIVAITDNQSGEIEAYNTGKDQQAWPIPIILIAPKDSEKAYALVKNGTAVSIGIDGEFKDVIAKNVYGSIGHGDKYIVVSTPISGWFTCGGERGSGLAIWLALAHWAATLQSEYTFIFTANSGHEHAFRGAHEFLEQYAPAPDKTKLWIHFGAGAATLEYKTDKNGLVRQLNVDPKRRFYFSESEKEAFNTAFEKITAEKILSNDKPGGELLYVAQKGYKNFVGVSYGHPFFHVKTDDANTTSPAILEETAKAFSILIENTIK